MGEETTLLSECVSEEVVEGLHNFEDGQYCTVILDSSGGSYIPILQGENGEEIIMYDDDLQDDVKVEIVEVCADEEQEYENQEYYTFTSEDVPGAQQLKFEEDPQIVEKPEVKKPLPKNPKDKTKIKSHTCAVCSKSFTQLVNLITHERIHTGEKPFGCHICMKHFSQQPNLWKHIRTHTGERPYQCLTCLKSFTQQANLTKHIRIHTGERPYACQYCGKRFTQQANLTKHVRLHTGERPFHCSFCPKTFVQQSNLERHERTHTGVKPFQCHICLDAFAQNAHLAKHIRSIHKQTPPVNVRGRRPQYVVKLNQSETEPANAVSSLTSELGLESEQEIVEEPQKKIGIPVLLCTKTGKIIKRVDLS